ncbi:DUF2147 domain-containing protein [Cytophagaceae bacterium ABcell3]|nr:DUF2147 domain-containing protein [Cytophagaceae bacterium ABcell3]
MKNTLRTIPLIVLSLMLSFTLSSFAPSAQSDDEGDALVGVWEPGNGRAKVKVSKIGDKYYGKIVWLLEPKNEKGEAKTDVNNPDESMRSTPLLGYRILKDFEYKGKKTWDNGTIYDPENGSTYSCTIKMKDDNTLEVRGYIGVSAIGRTDTWTRLQKKK